MLEHIQPSQIKDFSTHQQSLHGMVDRLLDARYPHATRQTLNRRDMMKLMAATALGTALAVNHLKPSHAESRTFPTIQEINALISPEDIMLGDYNMSEAARNGVPIHLSSETHWGWPNYPIPFKTYTDYTPEAATPDEWHSASLTQSITGNIKVGLHSSLWKGNPLPAEPMRAWVEGAHLTDFVGPVQTDYRVKKALQEKPHLQLGIDGKAVDFRLANFHISPFSYITNDVVDITMKTGAGKRLSIDTCGTSSSIAVEGFVNACSRMKLDQFPDVQAALTTLNTPDAEGSDIHAAIRNVLYPAVQSVDAGFAQFLLAMYSREKQTNNGFYTMTLPELQQEPIPGAFDDQGNQLRGIPFFTGKGLVASYDMVA